MLKYKEFNHINNSPPHLPPRTTFPQLTAFPKKEKETLKIEKICVHNFAICKNKTVVTPDSGRTSNPAGTGKLHLPGRITGLDLHRQGRHPRPEWRNLPHRQNTPAASEFLKTKAERKKLRQ